MTRNKGKNREYVRALKQSSSEYEIASGEDSIFMFFSVFLLEDVDKWCNECFEMIYERRDLILFLIKRI